MSFETHTWQPVIMDACVAADCALLREYLEEPGTVLFDKIDAQIDELARSREPALERSQLGRRRARHASGRPGWSVGRWIYYPWSRTLVHTLEPDEFLEIRSSRMRNRDRISAKEEARLTRARIGILGLSVGRLIAQTLAMEGVGRRFRLADGARLALSDLVRVPGSLAHISVPRVVLAARALLELDPYLDIEVFEHGLEPHRVDEFLGAPDSRLDLIVEECDALERASEIALGAATVTAAARRILLGHEVPSGPQPSAPARIRACAEIATHDHESVLS